MNRQVLFLCLTLAGVCYALPDQSEIAAAVASPRALAQYLGSHSEIDWKVLRAALGLKESEYWIAPCGRDSPVAEMRCSVKVVEVLNPEQVFLIIREDSFGYAIEYLRYLRDSGGGWRFAGENYAVQRNSPSHHTIIRVGKKPFLSISSDHSQNGFATQQIVQDYFDLTLLDFAPVFSVTVDGSQWRFGFGVGRTVHARSKFSESGGIERIDVVLDVRFNGPGLDQPAWYSGVYERNSPDAKFTLRRAYSDLDRHKPISTEDFEEIADPFSGLSNEKLLVYAFAGLQKITEGADLEAKEWLRSILAEAADTPEKRLLLEALKK